jgi:peptidoglycan/xylan/chitin deacetylase (PgdA/CDA1 family)
VPILMFHYISEPPPGANELRRDLSVSPESFSAQLERLRSEGYTSISMRDLVMHIRIGQPLPAKPLMLTFDDGHADHYTNAFPILRQHGFSGTFYVITGYADEGREEHLNWPQIVEMAEAGMEIGVHSLTHPDLRDQTLDYVVWQTLGPKQAIESRIPQAVTSFCYPFGLYDNQVVSVINSAHYWTGVTTQQGTLHTSDNLYAVERVRVRGEDDVDDLMLRIKYLINIAETATPTATMTAIYTTTPTVMATAMSAPSRTPTP